MQITNRDLPRFPFWKFGDIFFSVYMSSLIRANSKAASQTNFATSENVPGNKSVVIN